MARITGDEITRLRAAARATTHAGYADGRYLMRLAAAALLGFTLLSPASFDRALQDLPQSDIVAMARSVSGILPREWAPQRWVDVSRARLSSVEWSQLREHAAPSAIKVITPAQQPVGR